MGTRRFSFEENKDNILVRCINIDDAMGRYSDKYMAVVNCRNENFTFVGDIVAFFSEDEYKHILL